MNHRVLAAIVGVVLFSQALLAGEQRLSKSLLGLDDFFYAFQRSGVLSSSPQSRESSALTPSLYRDAIQYELVADTLWVKVFITTEPASQQAANTEFKALKLRALSQFGNIFAARIDLRQLPTLDRLPFVQRIEPVVPEGSAARASLTVPREDSPVKKK